MRREAESGSRFAVNLSPAENKESFEIYATGGFGPSFTVTTIHISCQSDTYLGRARQYGGIILYARNGQTDWYTANGTRCKSGYVVIMRTDSSEFEELQRRWPNEPGRVHGVIYRKAFGESCRGMNVVGEGFGIMNGVFRIISGAFNPADDEYHDLSDLMNEIAARYVQKVVDIWKSAGPNFPARQNYSVKELGD